MKLIFGIAVSLLVLFLWCCLKVASDEDERMGYDDILEERVDSDGF